MNRTLLCLTGLLLAAPLAAQSPSEMKASELLQLSAQKAQAGQQAEASKLAARAMELLNQQENDYTEIVVENIQEAQPHVIIVDGKDGRQVIKLAPQADGIFEWTSDAPEGREFIVNVEDHNFGNLETRHELPIVQGRVMLEGGPHHFAPMPHGDLHQQLAEIQHELESLRHELSMLRNQMGGGNSWTPRDRRQGNRRMIQFGNGGQWAPGPNQFNGGMHLEYRMGEEMKNRLHEHGIELHELEQLRGLGYIQMEEGLQDMGAEFDFEFPEDMHKHEEVVVIINGETFTGEAARKKLEELNLGDSLRGKIRLRMDGSGHGFPAPNPPQPPKAPSHNGGTWERHTSGNNHEDA